MKATTRPLSDFTDAALDLNDVAAGDGYLFVRNAVGMAGRGVAARVPIDEAAAVLAALPHDSTVDGAAPIALGVLDFSPGAPATVVIPQVLVRKFANGDDGGHGVRRPRRGCGERHARAPPHTPMPPHPAIGSNPASPSSSIWPPSRRREMRFAPER